MNTVPQFQMLAVTLLLSTPSRLHELVTNPTSGPIDLQTQLKGIGFSDDAAAQAATEYFGNTQPFKIDQPLQQGHLALLKSVKTRRELYAVLGVITQGIVSFYDGPGFHPTNQADNPAGIPQDQSIISKLRALDGQ